MAHAPAASGTAAIRGRADVNRISAWSPSLGVRQRAIGTIDFKTVIACRAGEVPGGHTQNARLGSEMHCNRIFNVVQRGAIAGRTCNIYQRAQYEIQDVQSVRTQVESLDHF